MRASSPPISSSSPSSPVSRRFSGKVRTSSYELKVQRKLHREKVIEFEKEMLQKLDQLSIIEKKKNEINEKRVEWLENISSQHYQDTHFFQNRVQLIRVQADLVARQLKMDIFRLESQLEAMQLATLVEGTRALDPQETLEKRELAMFLRQKNDLDNMKQAIQSSIDYRVQLANYLYQLLGNLQEIQVGNAKEAETALAHIQQQLKEFRVQMITITEQTTMEYQNIVQDYLILRHNANVIQEIIRRNQNQCIYHRNKIELDLQRITQSAKEKHYKLEVSNSKEITALTNDLRQEILHKEQIVEDLAGKVEELKQEKSANHQSIVDEILQYEKKIVTLEQKRKEEIQSIHFELQYLKQTIYSLQLHVFNHHKSEQDESINDDPHQKFGSKSQDKSKTRRETAI